MVERGHAVAGCADRILRVQHDSTSDQMLFEGAALEIFVAPPTHERGRNNLGMFRSTYHGQPVLLKISAGSSPEEFRDARIAEVVGGAQDDRAGPPRPPGSIPRRVSGDGGTLRRAGFLHVYWRIRRYGRASAKGGRDDGAENSATRLTRQLADWMVRGLDADVLPPFDLDFIFTSTQLRLIDGSSITTGRRAKSKDWDRLFCHSGLRLVARPLEEVLGPRVADRFRLDFLEALEHLVGHGPAPHSHEGRVWRSLR